MKTSAHILVASALVLIGFGWWGMETAAGREHFDGMAGTIPFVAGMIGWSCLLLASVLYVLVWRRCAGSKP